MSKRQYTTEFKREVVGMAAKGEKSIADYEALKRNTDQATQ